MTLIDLQGKLDREYLVGIFTSPTALRNNLRARWPESPEANLERLENCGLPYNRHIPKCRNCDGKILQSPIRVKHILWTGIILEQRWAILRSIANRSAWKSKKSRSVAVTAKKLDIASETAPSLGKANLPVEIAGIPSLPHQILELQKH